MAYVDEGFEMVSETSGTVSINMMGMIQQLPYEAKNHMNADGSIGYVDMISEGKRGFIFHSVVGDLDIITMSGDSTGPPPFPMEGFRMRNVEEDAPVEEYYAQHLENLGDDEPVADRDMMLAALESLPQTSTDHAIKSMQALMGGLVEGLGSMMSQIGEAFGGAGDGEGMDQAMEEFARAMSEGMGNMGAQTGEAIDDGDTSGEDGHALMPDEDDGTTAQMHGADDGATGEMSDEDDGAGEGSTGEMSDEDDGAGEGSTGEMSDEDDGTTAQIPDEDDQPSA
jgi:hypothetical protein